MKGPVFLDPFGAFALAQRPDGPGGSTRHETRSGPEPTWQRQGLRPGQRADARSVLVTGATGFVGRKLVRRLVERGDRVIALARNVPKARDLFGPHVRVVTALSDLPATTQVDAIVNLAGESVGGGLWTAGRKARLVGSRLAVTEALLGLVDRLDAKPTTWLNASAVGYYGVHGDDTPLHERSPRGSGFQADLCSSWESLAARAGERGVHVALLRFGVVLGNDGGALPSLARPVGWFAGLPLGSGRQWFSWIHIDDLTALMLFLLDERTLAGPFNATAPNPVRHTELMRAIARALHRPLWPLHVPAALLRVALGELAELFVDGQRVTPDRALALGFTFRHADIDGAVGELLSRGNG